MSDINCPFCALVSRSNESTYVHTFTHSIAYLDYNQTSYPGRCLLVLKQHFDHLHDVPRDLLHAFIDERSMLAAAIMKAFPATTRMNYANLGNAVSHVHEHLIPRYAGDPNDGRAPWPTAETPRLSDADYQAIAQRIAAKIPSTSI